MNPKHFFVCCVLALGVQAEASAQAQFNKLRIGVRLELDPGLRTVEEAVQWVLQPTGYRLTTQHPAPPESSEIAALPISALAHGAGLQIIEESLLLIAGSDTNLVVDHANKLVSFEYMQGEQVHQQATGAWPQPQALEREGEIWTQ